jgi:hypothetical protein
MEKIERSGDLSKELHDKPLLAVTVPSSLIVKSTGFVADNTSLSFAMAHCIFPISPAWHLP